MIEKGSYSKGGSLKQKEIHKYKYDKNNDWIKKVKHYIINNKKDIKYIKEGEITY